MNSPELSPRPLARPGLPAGRRGVAGERRGDFLGAQPGTGPSRRGGQPSSACKFVLVGLASHAGPDGTGAFPSVATLVRYTGLSERTVRTCLDRLEAEGIIQACDPDIIAARIKRADRRPKGWDLDLSLIRADLTDTEVAVLGRQFPGRGARAAAATCPDTREAPDGQSPHPASAVDNPADRVQQLHPASGTGATSARTRCNQCSHGVNSCTRTVQGTIPGTACRRRGCVRGIACQWRGGWRAGRRVLRRTGRRLAAHPTQRLKLVPAVTRGPERGWAPRVLAAFAGANTNGVRNPN